MKCFPLDCWDEVSQDTINEVIEQLLKILTLVIGHKMDMQNFDSTRMYTILALTVRSCGRFLAHPVDVIPAKFVNAAW